MHPFQAAQQIAQTREVDAASLINGQCDLRTYPYRHLTVMAGGNLPMSRTTAIAISAEILSQWGWELVSVTRPFGSVEKLVAFLRRNPPA